MSEEQSSFKVTDRRLFNADGTPRDVEREEAPPISSNAPSAGPVGAQAADTDRSRLSGVAATGQARDSRIVEERPEEAFPEEEIPGADDPASFVNFLMSIASNAAAALGMMEHPATGQRDVDLELAKHWIDVLGMLQQKTKGNLLPQEQRVFEGLLSDLRMQYVALTKAGRGPAGPRGFTGSDITGGRRR